MRYTSKVDSAKISIPLEYCDIINKDLIDFYQLDRTNLVTGEVETVKEYQGEPFILNTNYGTYYKIWIEKQPYGKGLSKPFLALLVNSKHLGKHYFKGITKDTVSLLYDNIMSKNVFKCTFDDFLKARYNDTDIAFDFKCKKESFEILKKNIKNSTLYPHLWAVTNKHNNSGIWTPKTPTSVKPRNFATPSKPYIKFYSKQIDFQYKSKLFADKFNLHNQAKDIVRYECTIKNHKHKELLKINELKTLGDLLNSDLNKIASDMFRRYFERCKFVKSKSYTPMDYVLINFINDLIEAGRTEEQIFEHFNNVPSSRKSKANLRKKYFELRRSNKIDKELLEANEISSNVFDFLGVSLRK